VSVGNLFERVAPTVGGAYLLIGNTYGPNPFSETITCLNSQRALRIRDLSGGCLLVKVRIMKQRTFAFGPDEFEEALSKQVLMQRNSSGHSGFDWSSIRCDTQGFDAIPLNYVLTA
jgi:hypothetical protein